MIKLYASYLAANFIVPFVVSTVFFVSFLMTFELFRIMTLISSDDITLGFLAGLMGDVMVTLVPMAIPISIFFSIIFTLNRLSGDSEYVAMRAGGLDKKRVLLPFMLIAILTSVSIYFFNQEVVPNAHRQVRKKIKIISSTSLIQGLKSGQFFTRLHNVTIFPAYVDQSTKELKDVYLYLYNEKDKSEKVISAKEGKILHKKDGTTGIESFKLLLKEGNITTSRSEKPGDVEKILFEEYTFPISEQKFSYKTSMKEIMMNKKDLSAFIDGGLKAAKKKGFDKKDFFNAKYEYWNRYNTSILCIILSFLGFCLGITGTRGKKKNSSGKAILILILYYVLYFGLVSIAKEGTIPIPLALIIPAVVLLVIGQRAYVKLDWIS